MTAFYGPQALLSQRASGYRNTTYALAEIIDNSFDASASDVYVAFIEKRIGNRRRVHEILIMDNGLGMDPDIQQTALQFGSTSNTDIEHVVSKKKMGKFGYGLPNASLSQCPSVHVYSWPKSPDKMNYVYLDLSEVISKQSIEIPKITSTTLPPRYESIVKKFPKTGTIVIWRECDRLTNTKGQTLIGNASLVLGRLYRYLLSEGRTIKCEVFEEAANGTYTSTFAEEIKPFDPLFLMPDTQVRAYLEKDIQTFKEVKEPYEKFLTKSGVKPTNEPFAEGTGDVPFEWKGKTYNFKIVTSVANIDIQKPGMREGGNTETGKLYGEKMREGNITFVRSKREIASGTFDGFYKHSEVRHRWWTVEVQFDPAADDLLGVHNNKQGIEFRHTEQEVAPGEDPYDSLTAEFIQARQALWALLTNRISGAVKKAFKCVKDQAATFDAQQPGINVGGGAIPTGTGATSNVVLKVDGPRKASLPKEERDALVEKLSDKYPQVKLADIESAVELIDKAKTRACIIYAPSDVSNQLWSITRFYNILIVTVNTTHEFYQRFISELRNTNNVGALTAVELFLSSLAVEEDKLNADEDSKDAIEQFRSNVGSHLHRYIKSIPENTDFGIEAESDE